MEKEEFIEKVKRFGLDIKEANLYFLYCKKKNINASTYFDYLQETRQYQVIDGNLQEIFTYSVDIPPEIDIEMHPIK